MHNRILTTKYVYIHIVMSSITYYQWKFRSLNSQIPRNRSAESREAKKIEKCRKCRSQESREVKKEMTIVEK